MQPTMDSEAARRHGWEIDKVLERFVGENIRVAADSFIPIRWDGQPQLAPIATRTLVLSDQSQPGVLPVYFEGCLQEFSRRIGVVYARLNAPSIVSERVEGAVPFRGSTAVILPGPAIVRLAFPFVVEKLPGDAANYWEDLRCSRAQLWLPFP